VNVKLISSSADTLVKDLNRLRPNLRKLQQGLHDLKEKKISLEQSQNNKESNNVDKVLEKVTKLARLAGVIEKGTKDALEKCSSDTTLTNVALSAMESRQLPTSDIPRRFCDGAKLFQSGDKDDDYLSILAHSSPSKSGWGYICKHCGLEVGHYPAVRISREGKALNSSILLTASHLVAFRSLQDRRAFYRCLACYKKRIIVEFSTAVAFEMHMEQHPRFTLLKPEDEQKIINYMAKKEALFMAPADSAKGGAENSRGNGDNTIDSEENTDQADVHAGHQSELLEEEDTTADTRSDVSDVSDDEENLIPNHVCRPLHDSATSEALKTPKLSQTVLSGYSLSVASFETSSSASTIPGSFPTGTSGSVTPVVVESSAKSAYEVEGNAEYITGRVSNGSEMQIKLAAAPVEVGPSVQVISELPAGNSTPSPQPISQPTQVSPLRVSRKTVLRTPSPSSSPSNKNFQSASTTIRRQASPLVPSPIQATTPATPDPSAPKPEYWVMANDIYKGYIAIGHNPARLVQQQTEMPVAAWICRADKKPWNRNNQWMKKTVEGNIIFDPGTG
jgi:hypothetical protein